MGPGVFPCFPAQTETSAPPRPQACWRPLDLNHCISGSPCQRQILESVSLHNLWFCSPGERGPAHSWLTLCFSSGSPGRCGVTARPVSSSSFPEFSPFMSPIPGTGEHLTGTKKVASPRAIPTPTVEGWRRQERDRVPRLSLRGPTVLTDTLLLLLPLF